MTGQPDARQPRSGQKVKSPSSQAWQALLYAQLRAEAAAARASAFTLLAMQFGQKIAAAQQRHRGPALEAALYALVAEQRAAETALAARLKAEDAARRKAIGKELKAKGKRLRAVQFRAAGAEVADRKPGAPGRPRDRQRGTRAPRLRR